MATSGTFNGTNLILKVIADGGTLATIGHTTSCSISLSNDLPIATTKDQYHPVRASSRALKPVKTAFPPPKPEKCLASPEG